MDVVEDAGFDPVEAFDAGVDMPGGINGIALALKGRHRWPLIEVIIVSGKRMPEAEELPERGVFFSKPYKRSEMIEALHCFAS